MPRIWSISSTGRENGDFRLMVRPYTVDVEMSVRFCQVTLKQCGLGYCNGPSSSYLRIINRTGEIIEKSIKDTFAAK